MCAFSINYQQIDFRVRILGYQGVRLRGAKKSQVTMPTNHNNMVMMLKVSSRDGSVQLKPRVTGGQAKKQTRAQQDRDQVGGSSAVG